MKEECDHLEAYLSGELTPIDEKRFETHVAKCTACREAIDQQLWIDSLLRSPQRTVIESPSMALLDVIRDIRTTIPERRSHRREYLIACGLAAAILVAAGWIFLSNNRVISSNHPQTEIAPSAQATKRFAIPSLTGRKIFNGEALEEYAHDIKPPLAIFVGTGNTIAVPLETADSNVTVVRLYSAYQPAVSATVSIDPESSLTEFDVPINN